MNDPAPGRVRLEWTVAVLATLAAIAVRVMFVEHAGALWRDEANTASTALAPSFARMWRLMEFESFPILWPALVRGWIAIGPGSTDAGLRLLGFLGGISLVPAMWFASLRLGRRPPLIGLALVAVNPEIARWGTSPRAWGLGAALAIVAFAATADAQESPTWPRVAVSVLATLLCVQCVYQNVVPIAAIAGASVVVAVATREWRRAAIALGAAAVAAVSLLPYAATVERRSVWNGLLQGPITIVDIAGRMLGVAASSGAVVGLCWAALPVAAIVFLVRGRADRAGVRNDVATYAVWVGALTTIGLAGLYLIVRLHTQTWYYVGALALVAACADVALAVGAPAGIARTSALAALAILAIGLVPALAVVREPQTNIDAVAGYLNRHAVSGDVVLVDPWAVGVSLNRYYTAPADVETVPPIADHTVHRYDLLRDAMMTGKPIDPLLARIQHTLQAGHRLWEISNVDAGPRDRSVTNLPRPPLAGSGWSSGPYERQWASQMQEFLDTHAVRREAVAVDLHGGRFETMRLSVVSGWQFSPR